jgi:hypothetical protein
MSARNGEADTQEAQELAKELSRTAITKSALTIGFK